MRIHTVTARQILDSRGEPTVEAKVVLEGGAEGIASAPAGASTGTAEARERRDGGRAFSGRGVLGAVESVRGEIDGALRGIDAREQRRIDEVLISLDGTKSKGRLGANAIVAVSLACACAAARAEDLPLWRYIGGVSGGRCPCPMMNVLNGGAHADNNVDIQEFMLAPIGAASFEAAVRMGAETYRALKEILREKGLSTAVGDEGGFAPNLKGDEDALALLVAATQRAGYAPGRDIALALDVAAGSWADGNGYLLPKRLARKSREEMLDWLEGLVHAYPVISLEDPLGEEDFEGFAELTGRIGSDVMIVGDDLFVTNPMRLRRGIAEGSANAVLIKPNQIGTLSETIDAIRTARGAGYRLVLSHRSGETESSVVADIACAVNADYLKAGAPARGERTAKYNRVMAIEAGWR